MRVAVQLGDGRVGEGVLYTMTGSGSVAWERTRTDLPQAFTVPDQGPVQLYWGDRSAIPSGFVGQNGSTDLNSAGRLVGALGLLQVGGPTTATGPHIRMMLRASPHESTAADLAQLPLVEFPELFRSSALVNANAMVGMGIAAALPVGARRTALGVWTAEHAATVSLDGRTEAFNVQPGEVAPLYAADVKAFVVTTGNGNPIAINAKTGTATRSRSEGAVKLASGSLGDVRISQPLALTAADGSEVSTAPVTGVFAVQQYASFPSTVEGFGVIATIRDSGIGRAVTQLDTTSFHPKRGFKTLRTGTGIGAV